MIDPRRMAEDVVIQGIYSEFPTVLVSEKSVPNGWAASQPDTQRSMPAGRLIANTIKLCISPSLNPKPSSANKRVGDKWLCGAS
jgi:hypothetical protein